MTGFSEAALRWVCSRLVLLLFVCSFSHTSNAQYFNGPNKPGYKIFDYQVYNTPHFEIYHYFTNDSLLNAFAQSLEKWYARHLMIFKDTFEERNPIIIYADHADFQQTNAIMGNIGVGTGGVTEALKNRIVMPVMESAAQTDHVLGHEMVHAFQYKLLLGEDSTQQRNLRNIPLWMIEGMAEYLSIGSKDAHTAMWMRDAILSNDFPTLEDMSRSYKYFPYRYGQSFWAYLAGSYGDSIVVPMFDLTTKLGYDKALDSLTVFDEKTFSNAWKLATKEYYYGLLKDTVEKPAGRKILSSKNSGTINIAPSLSPDGNYVIYLSEKDLFTFDLYMANAHTGKVIKRVSSTIRNNKIDDFNYLESGGSWSPDAKWFVFVTFSKGKNTLLLIDVNKSKHTTELEIPGLDAISNPSWSPDGKTIVVTGLVGGVTDLFAYNIDTKQVQQLTNDAYANLMPAWSPDGKKLLFSTDKPSGDAGNHSTEGYRIAILDIATNKIEVMPFFPGAENLNPQFGPNSQTIYFVSDAFGIRNLYKYLPQQSEMLQLTNVLTGVSGITAFTPSFTIDRTQGNILYTHYSKSEYNIYQMVDTGLPAITVRADSVNFSLACLPPYKRVAPVIVDNNLAGGNPIASLPKDSFKKTPYLSKFSLDYIGGSSAGVEMNSYYGTGMAGSVDMLFGDMVGNYQLYSSLAIKGQVQDFAGSVAFMNNKKKIDWGVALSHIPYKYGMYSFNSDTLNIDIQYIFEDAFTLFAIKPITQTQRIEASASISYYSYYRERYLYWRQYYYLGRQRNLPVGSGFGIATLGAAYTLDNAYMGIASPLRGQRFRADVEYYAGSLQFLNILLDYRKYFYFRPFCLATRLYHQGRYGNNSTNNVIRALYIGWPWLVRGMDNVTDINSYSDISSLFGSHLGVANIELRIPFTGPERLCVIPFKYFFSELSFFVDAGIAWSNTNKLSWKEKPVRAQNIGSVSPYFTANNSKPEYPLDYSKYRYPIVNYGVSLRINLFGYMVLEPYYAIPTVKNGTRLGSFGLNFLPGW